MTKDTTKNDFDDKTTEDLKNSLNLIKMITTALVIVLILLVSINTYGMIMKEDKAVFIALFAVAFSCAAILPMQFISMKKIKNEIKSRNA